MTDSHDMTCKELVELVTQYVEGAMRPPERRAFEAHLAECPPCVTYLEQMRRTIEIVGTLREESIPDEAADALLQTFRDWKQTRPAQAN